MNIKVLTLLTLVLVTQVGMPTVTMAMSAGDIIMYSKQLEVSTKDFQVLHYYFVKQNGVPEDEFIYAMKYNRGLQLAARNGDKKALKTVKRLGYTQADIDGPWLEFLYKGMDIAGSYSVFCVPRALLNSRNEVPQVTNS